MRGGMKMAGVWSVVVSVLATAMAVVVPADPTVQPVEADTNPAARSAVSIASNCAATTEGEVWCWGENWAGQLGNGQRGFSSYDDIHSNVPVQVPGLTGIVEVTTGPCARNAAGTVWCWGDNGTIEDGEGSLYSDPPWGTSTPTIRTTGPAVKIVNRCALRADGTIWCFGWNNAGQLGNGTGGNTYNGPGQLPDHSAVPVQVVGINDAIDTSGVCAVRQGGTVMCWGSGVLLPQTVDGITDAVKVFGGLARGCVIRQGDKVSCWGLNTGQLFTAAADGATIPLTELEHLAGARQLYIGGQMLCAVRNNGQVTCQGKGALGDGVNHSTRAVVDLPGITTAVEMSGSGWGHHCVRTIEGEVTCWGNAYRGALGNGVSTGQFLSLQPLASFVPTPVEMEHLEVTLTADPAVIDVPEPGEGEGEEPESWTVNVTVRIENVSEFDVGPVRAEERLVTGLLVGEQKLIEQTGGPLVDPVLEIDETQLGTIPLGEYRELEYTFEISGSGVYEVNTLILYRDPVEDRQAAARGEVQIRVGVPVVVEGDLHFLGPSDVETVTAGQSSAVFVELENTSNTATVSFDRSAVRVRGAGAGGVLVDLEDDPPPLPAPGACPVPEKIVLGPGERVSLKTYVYTAPGGGTRAWVDLPVAGVIEDPLDGDRPLVVSDVSWADGRDELTLSVLDPGASYGDASWGEVIESFTIGFLDATVEWALSMFGGLYELVKLLLSPVLQPLQTLKALEHAVVFAWTVEKMTPLQKAAFSLQVATTVANATGEAVESVQASFEAHMTEVFEAMYSGNTTRFARLVGGDLATVALEVGLCEAAVGRLVKVAAESRAGVQLLKLSRTGLSSIRSGTVIGRSAVHAFGYQRKLVDDIATFAQRNNLNITMKNREPDAIANISGRQARMKPEFIKPKNVNDIDIEVLGFPASSKATVAVRPGLASEIPDLATLQVRFNAAKAANPGKYTDEMFELVVKRWEVRRGELTKYMPELNALNGQVVPRPFNTVDNGLEGGIGVTKAEKFEIVDIGGGTVELRLDGKPVTSDVDILSITQANGAPLTPEQRIAVYKHLEEIADLQHPESATWVRYGDGGEQIADFETKTGIFRDYAETLPGELPTTPALQFSADGQIRAVRFIEGGSVFNSSESYFVHWAGGFHAEGTRTLAISGDISGYNSLNAPTAAEWAAIGATPVLGGAWVLGPGGERTTRQSNSDDAGTYRPDGNGGAQEYVPPATGLSGPVAPVAPVAYAGTATGTWQAVPASRFTGKTVIDVLPQTLVTEPVAAGTSTLPVFTRDDLAYVGGTDEPLLPIAGWFTPGRRIAIDPGGPNEELATIAAINPFTLTTPLTKHHGPGEMVIALKAPTSGGGGGGSGFTPLSPARLLDTRTSGATIDGQHQGGGRRGAGTTVELTVTGRGGVPNNATAVVLNVTVAAPLAAGFITVYPCGTTRPNASNLNYQTGQTIPNLVIARVGTGGKVCLYTEAATNLIADVTGAFPAATTYQPLNPARVLDTRPSGATIDGAAQRQGRRPAGTVTELQVTGRGGVPNGATAVVLNVTVTGATAAGFITVYPCGTTRPNASNLNYQTGQTIPNLVIARVGTGGKVCLYNEAATNLIADVTGAWPSTSDQIKATNPARLLDTRPSGATVDGAAQRQGRRPAGTVTELQVTGRGGVPNNATAVVLNVTVTGATAAGFVTVYPCGTARPNASNLNYQAGQTIPNLVIARIGTGGKVCLYNEAPTNLIADATATT